MGENTCQDWGEHSAHRGVRVAEEWHESGPDHYYRQIEEEEKERQEEEEKAAGEAAEAVEYFNQLDTDQDGQDTVAELQVNSMIHLLRLTIICMLRLLHIICVS